MRGNHAYVLWAIEVIEKYIRENLIIDIPEYIPHQLLETQAGAFVSLHTENNTLRGCIGTILPTQKNLALEIRENAIAAATRDPRFNALSPDELAYVTVSVDVLSMPVSCEEVGELDPKRYGVIVESGYRRGLLLPDLDGVDTVEMQLNIARRKAGIAADEQIKIYQFEVNRYH
ncbi:MAG TPA: AmmeMemoRadiSam system protein A [Thermotogota bacterium]|nr:AmmeMemoRadiSam system protein A [Thermotogota bacterium]HPJ88497.1 AmmeMemoRadiSam system protein A [Thermotogota bacterium]HPR96197.1 AmmeMemoRadiSam system protein A [Thermotogota bacterium]